MKNSVRDLRGQVNWTQANLAEKLGVSRQTVNAIETEKYDPSLPLAFRLAKLFDKPIETIFEPDTGAPNDGQPPIQADGG